MTAHSVVTRILEYLDRSPAGKERLTLVGLHWFVDGHEKTLPTTEEVNLALGQRPQIFVLREEREVLFGRGGTERTVSDTDMRVADEAYRKEFWAKLKELRST